MARFKTLLFHVGDMKTGTTSIQAALAAGNTPSGKSISYPGSALNHNQLAPALAKPSDTIRPRVAKLRKLIEAASSAEICIISAENLSHASPRLIAHEMNRWLSDIAEEIRIVQYVRPHISYLTSRYVEAVKTGAHSGTLEAWADRMIDSQMILAASRASEWREAFGSKYAIRPFIRSELKRGDVVGDFFHTVLETLPSDWVSPVSTNEALPVEAVEALKQLHASIGPQPAAFKNTVGRHFALVYGNMFDVQKGTKVRPSESLARKIFAACAVDAERLDAEQFDGRNVFRSALEADLMSACSHHDIRPPSMSASDVMQVMGRVVAEIAATGDAAATGSILHQRRSHALIAAASR